jgi:hypothetical protein
VRAFAAERKIGYPLLVQPSDALLIDYIVMSLPQTLVVTPSGVVLWRAFGPIQPTEFRTQLDRWMSSEGDTAWLPAAS